VSENRQQAKGRKSQRLVNHVLVELLKQLFFIDLKDQPGCAPLAALSQSVR
jgi:hypothetical protein